VLSPEANARYEKIIAEFDAEKKASKVKEFTNFLYIGTTTGSAAF